MVEEKPFSIFDSPSKKKKSPPSPPKARPSKETAPKEPKTVRRLDSEIQNLIDKMRKMHEEIEVKLDEAYQQSGLDPSSIKNYLDNPNNFKPTEWEGVQMERKSRLESIAKQIGAQISSPLVKTAKEISKTDRTRKTLGVRRNWISMR